MARRRHAAAAGTYNKVTGIIVVYVRPTCAYGVTYRVFRNLELTIIYYIIKEKNARI